MDTIYRTLTVHRSGPAANSRPRIQLWGDWLTGLGFIDGALVQTLPEPDGLSFHLCNEDVKYSDLFHETKEKGGILNRIYTAHQRTIKGPVLVTTGRHIKSAGLAPSDALIAGCEHGCIRLRKVGGNVRLIHVTKAKDPRTKASIPQVFLLGDWLAEAGFLPDTLMTAKAQPGCITFTAHEQAVIYRDVVKFARQNNMKVLQVSAKNGKPLIKVTGSFAKSAGFGIEEFFVCDYAPGRIQLQKFDPRRFGF